MLPVALGGGEDLLGGGVLAQQRGAHLLFVELQLDHARPLVYRGVGTVVEDGDGAVLLTAGVVLEGGVGALSHFEVALLTAQAPQDPAALAVDLVDSPGVS